MSAGTIEDPEATRLGEKGVAPEIELAVASRVERDAAEATAEAAPAGDPGWARRLLPLVERWFAWTPVAAAAVVFARFLQLGWYAQPQADDFDYSVLYTRYGFWGAQVKWFYGWNGRYFFNAATTAAVAWLDPARSYWLIPTIMFGLVFWAFHDLFKKAVGLVPLHAVAGAVTASGFLVLTSPVRSDAYYWATGVTLYPLANVGVAFWAIAAFRLYAAETPARRWREAAILALLSFMIIGCNETSMLVLDALVAAATFVALLRVRRSLLPWIVVLAACGACSLLVMKAPGNLVRESFMAHRGELKLAVEKTTEQTKQLLGTWSTSSLLVALTVLGWPWARRAGDRARAVFPGLGAAWIAPLTIAGTAALVWISVFPSWWSKGAACIPRTLNVSYFTFLLGWAAAATSLATSRVGTWTPGFSRLMMALASAAVVYLSLTHETYAAAVKDLDGPAPAYRKELRARYAQIRAAKASGERDVVVDPVKSPPTQLYIIDLFACTEGWPNSSYAEHFGLRSIRPRGAPKGSCGAVPPAAQKVVNPYSIHLFRPPE